MRRERWARVRRFLRAPLLVGALVAPSLARAAPEGPALRVEGSCPTRERVLASLAPLLPAPSVDESATSSSVTVRDEGGAYRVVVAGREHVLRDEARDCDERARAAAVVIALAARPSEPPRPSVISQVPPPRGRLHVELQAVALVDGSPQDGSVVGAGGGLRLTLGGAWLAASLGVAALSPGDLAAGAVAVRLTRWPVDLGLRLSLGRARVTGIVEAGVVLVPLVAQATNLNYNTSALALDVGARGALGVGVALSPTWRAFLVAEAVGVPVPTRLDVMTRGRVGTTPSVWLGASLGVAWRIR